MVVVLATLNVAEAVSKYADKPPCDVPVNEDEPFNAMYNVSEPPEKTELAF